MNDEHQQRMQEIEASKLDDVRWVKRNLPQFYDRPRGKLSIEQPVVDKPLKHDYIIIDDQIDGE